MQPTTLANRGAQKNEPDLSVNHDRAADGCGRDRFQQLGSAAFFPAGSATAAASATAPTGRSRSRAGEGVTAAVAPAVTVVGAAATAPPTAQALCLLVIRPSSTRRRIGPSTCWRAARARARPRRGNSTCAAAAAAAAPAAAAAAAPPALALLCAARATCHLRRCRCCRVVLADLVGAARACQRRERPACPHRRGHKRIQ